MSKQKITYIALSLILLTIFSTSFFVQVSESSKASSEALGLVVENEYISPPRGLILSENGQILANNIEVFDVYLNYSTNQSDDYKNIQEKLKSNKEIPQDLIKKFDFTKELSNQNVQIAKNLFANEVSKIKFLTDEYKDLEIKLKYLRKYKYPEEFSHIIGYTGKPTEEELANNYKVDDSSGRYRLEAQLEDYLKGTKTKTTYLNSSKINYPGEQGNNVYLTINEDWQLKMYDLLKNYDDRYNSAGGSAVIMNANTGEIETLVSFPGFDNNKFVFGISDKEFKNLQQNRDKPLLDKAVSSAYTPGSIFKLISSYAFLDSGIIDGSSTYFSDRCLDIGTYRLCEFGKFFYGTVNVERALIKSSNLFFCNYSLVDEARSTSEISKVAKLLGLGEKTGIDLSEEASGVIDSPQVKKERVNDSWYSGDTCNLVIGQGATLVTPIQMARLTAALDNGGLILEPFVVKEIKDVNGNILQKAEKKVIADTKLNQNSLNLIKNGMYGVAYDSSSATYLLLHNLPNNVKAKTGSAETVEIVNGNVEERVHSWIVGTFEYKGQTYSYALNQIYGGGGYYITEMLKEFLEYVNNN